MKIRRRWFYGMASAAIITLVITLNTTGSIGKPNIVNAMAQTSKAVKVNDTKGKSILQSKVEVLANKGGTAGSSASKKKEIAKAQVEVPVNIEVEKGDQKNADAGSSPWKLNPAFVSQVFVSLKISPEGIQGDYPIKYEELKLVESTEKEAVVDVSAKNTTIGRVYLKRLVKQDNTGIWTVVGYDSVNNK